VSTVSAGLWTNLCELKWQKPEDDGVVPIDHYTVEPMDTEI